MKQNEQQDILIKPVQTADSALFGPHRIVTLTADHIPAMLALQAEAGDGQIVMRDEHTLRAHFNAGHTAIGAVYNGQLVAQSLLRTETLRDEFTQASRVQSTISGVVVSPRARGCGLMNALVQDWLDRAARDGATVAHARVRVGNEASWKVFLANNLAITAQGASPDDPSQQVFYMNLNLQNTGNENIHTTRAPIESGIGDYLARGYIATGWDKKARLFKMTMAAQPF